MKEESKFKLKAFLWDQFVSPIVSVFNVDQIYIILTVFAFLSIFLKIPKYILPLLIIQFIVAIYKLVIYYRSGEFIKNYRDAQFKKKNIPNYRETIKKIRKEKKELISPVNEISEVKIEETKTP